MSNFDRNFKYTLVLFLFSISLFSKSGKWHSEVTGENITYTLHQPKHALKDYFNKQVTIVYLTNLSTPINSTVSNKKNIRWLCQQGYQVIELNYKHHPKTVSPYINADIIAINNQLAKGNFCNQSNCSNYQSYVLFEGYRIARNVPYFVDDPTVYNSPDYYTVGDTLNMDIAYPYKPKRKVPTLLSFSYSNSYATYDKEKQQLIDINKNQRLNLGYTLAGFNDSVLEGIPAIGMAWAIADHPKYCSWGKGKPVNGKNDTYKAYQVNPDAVQKVKSAIRTLRYFGQTAGLTTKIGIFGFSRGSTAGSLAIGDKIVQEFENAGMHQDIADDVQVALLGPGVFDYTMIYEQTNDGDGNMELRCPWAWGDLTDNYNLWETMGATYMVASDKTAPVLFFYNTDDELYYQAQIAHLKQRLDDLQVPNESLINYGKGHSIPQDQKSLTQLYNFLARYLK